jgi:predicted nucleotidyltransferase
MARKVWAMEELRRRLAPPLAAAGAKRAIIFGSHARGEADEWSDLDLLIVADTDLPFLDRFRAFRALYDVYPHSMEILVYTPEEFAQMVMAENSFIEQVLKDGLTIHEG